MAALRLVFLLLLFPIWATGFAEDTVVITGSRRRSTEHTGRDGLKRKVVPRNSAGMQLDQVFGADAAFVAAQTGMETPASAPVPRIRGQNHKATEVWLDSFQLYDPWNDSAAFLEVDMRALGGVELASGSAHQGIPTMNPVGTLRYLFANRSGEWSRVGAVVNPIQGSGTHLLVQKETGSQLTITSRLFASSYQGHGRFSYFDDHGTPFNLNDDRLAERSNNAHQIMQVLPFVSVEWASSRLQLLGWKSNSAGGVPSTGALVSEAHYERSNDLFGAFYQLEPKAFRGLTLGLNAEGKASCSELVDPTFSLRLASQRVEQKLSSQKMTLFAEQVIGEQATLKVSGSIARTQLNTQSSSETQIDRAQKMLFLQSVFDLWSGAQLDLTYQVRESSSAQQAKSYPSYGFGVHQSIQRFTLYAQWMRYHRPPTLLEQYGDGERYLEASVALAAEHVAHREVGLLYRPRLWVHSVGVSLFEDTTSEKILFLPAYYGTFRAVNAEKTKISGMELLALLSLSEGFELDASYLYLRPEVLRDGYASTAIPMTPMHTLALQGRLDIFQFWLFSWQMLYRSKAYLDISNATELYHGTQHHVSLGASWLWEHVKWVASLRIQNLFDVKAEDIVSEQGLEGRTALMENPGYPLAGRSFSFELSLTF